MMPHPFASGHRRLYSNVSVKNDTPHKVNFARVEYWGCASDENSFIASGGAWTVGTCRGGCLVEAILSSLIPQDGSELKCKPYLSTGTGIASFYIMLHNGECCLRSWKQSNTECPKKKGEDFELCG